MIHPRCISIELLLERKAPPLSHAERLRVEAHLAECKRCRNEHAGMLELLWLVEDRVQSAARNSVQERALARALTRSSAPPIATSAPASAPAWSRLSLALAAAALLALIVGGIWSRTSADVSSVAEQLPRYDRIVSGTLRRDGASLSHGSVMPAERELELRGPAVLELAHAHIAIERAEALAWSPQARSLTLRAAVAEVSVDPTARRSFRVVTQHFSVDVVGTQFRVHPDGVQVRRGRVRVLSPEGTLLAELGAGQAWTRPTSAAALSPEPSRHAEPELPAAPAAASERPSAAQAPVSGKLGQDGVKQVLSAAELLSRARQRLAKGDARAARADLDAALAAGATRSEQAEAGMLRADCALVEGNAKSAVALYLEVSRRFSGMRAAETALFSAARVESNSGNRAAAKKLLLAYQEKYPGGQFQSEVLNRLRLLEQP
jgi:TolA-binding protein